MWHSLSFTADGEGSFIKERGPADKNRLVFLLLPTGMYMEAAHDNGTEKHAGFGGGGLGAGGQGTLFRPVWTRLTMTDYVCNKNTNCGVMVLFQAKWFVKIMQRILTTNPPDRSD